MLVNRGAAGGLVRERLADVDFVASWMFLDGVSLSDEMMTLFKIKLKWNTSWKSDVIYENNNSKLMPRNTARVTIVNTNHNNIYFDFIRFNERY